MIEKIGTSNGKILGFRLIGDVDKSDYDVMIPAVQRIIDQQGSVSLLLDLQQFRWEKVEVWGADLNFGREYHEKIDKIAIIGDKQWEKLLAVFGKAYAKDTRYFHSCDIENAWEWLKE